MASSRLEDRQPRLREQVRPYMLICRASLRATPVVPAERPCLTLLSRVRRSGRARGTMTVSPPLLLPAHKSSAIGRTFCAAPFLLWLPQSLVQLDLRTLLELTVPHFLGLFTDVLASFILFWGLRAPAALLELYITRRHSRHWILWPHGLAMITTVVAIAGNESDPGHSPMFRHVLSTQAATVGLLYYLIFAPALLIPVGIAALIMNLVPPVRRQRGKRRVRHGQAPASTSSR